MYTPVKKKIRYLDGNSRTKENYSASCGPSERYTLKIVNSEVNQAIIKIKKQTRDFADEISVIKDKSIDVICKDFLSNLTHRDTQNLWKRML